MGTTSSPECLCEIFLFGDQTARFAPALQELLLNKNSPYLTAFVGRVNFALKKEISSLPVTERQNFPSFVDVGDLVSKFQQDTKNPALESTLVCFYQLCAFIQFYDCQGRSYPRADGTHIVGLCVGSLAAAAVSCSQSLSDLLVAGVDTVRVAFRLGLRVLHTAELFDAASVKTKDFPSWSVAVAESVLPRTSAEDTLRRFIYDTGLASSSAPYISSISHHSLTISGPPLVLDKLAKTLLSSPKDAVSVPIHAPYHAPHLYAETDVDEILAASGPICPFPSRIPVISGASGKVFEALHLPQLLRSCVKDMLTLSLNITNVSNSVASVLSDTNAANKVLRPISSSIATSVLSSLEPSVSRGCRVDSSITKPTLFSLRTVEQPPRVISGRSHHSKIAIVAMSGRFPDAANLDEFWDVLYQGRDVHRQVPEDRFNAESHYDATGRRKNTSKVLNGCWIEKPGQFDAKFFNISPKEAEQSDPGQRLALETAYEALEMAGIVPDRTPSTQRDRVGVFYGMTSDDWREVNSGQNVDTYFIPGGNRAFTPGRLNYFFKFSGPSASIDTACSSSLTAIHMACNSLWRNDCDTAIAGGTNIMTNPDNFAGLDRGHFLSRTGNCNTFDDGADGYCRADGVGTIVLKRLEDAEEDSDPILGVIAGAYTNHSAEAVSITRPHAGAQEYIFSKLLRESGIDPYDISYVEMHGTGTQAGDATEMSSVLKTFAPTGGRGGRSPHQSLHLGSAKANVGHAESASGVVALIKTLLMLQNNTIPPHCGIKTKINHHFPTDLAERNVHIARAATPWNRPAGGSGIRRSFVNNFSAAGGNSALLLEDAPVSLADDRNLTDPRTTHVVAISARSVGSLKRNLDNLKAFVERAQVEGDFGFLTKLSYTTTARRTHHQFRIALSAQTPEQLLSKLAAASQREEVKRMPVTLPSVGFVFSGQGAQYGGMGKEYFTSFSLFRSAIQAYDRIGQSQGLPSILPLITGEADVESSSPVEIQLSLTCLQMALAKLWKSFGIEPSFVLGHSLGHYAALNVAGVLSASDTIYLTGTRAQLLLDKCEAGSHAMLAVRASVLQIRQFLNANIHEVACVNGPREVVISGKVTDINQLAEHLAADNIKATRVQVPFAFHSAQVDPILSDLDAAASRVTFHSPQIPMLCALEASIFLPGDHGSIGPLHMQRHCRETVNFEGALKTAEREGLISTSGSTLWIEIGPHAVCSTFLKASLGQNTMTIPSLRRAEDPWRVLSDGLSNLYNAGLAVDWNEYHRDFAACHQVLRLPSYSWDHKNYWIQYVHDWSLTKGDAPIATQHPITTSPISTPSTPSVQKIVQETLRGQELTLLAESDLASPLLAEIAHGHLVNGVKVCTSSLYADVGLTLGNYILSRHRPDLLGYAANVHHMQVYKPLILKEDASGTPLPTPFYIEVNYRVDTMTASMTIRSSGSHHDGPVAKHVDCELHFENPKDWESEWDRQAYLIKRSIEYLENRATQGLDSTLATGMIYKVFSSLVDYQQDGFKGLREVVLHSEDLEGTAKVRFRGPRGGFYCNPLWIDSCGQTTGFLMNCHQTTPRDYVYVNHGWKSMKLAREFQEDTTYRTYIHMRPVDGTKYAGDLYILDENSTIIGVYGDITFQGLPRRVLNTVLPPPGATPPEALRGHRERPQPSPMHHTSLEAPGDKTVPSRPAVGAMTMPPPPAADDTSPQLRPLLRILSEEIGLSLSDLNDDDLDFADHGVDSLLSLTLTGRMREDLGIDVDSSAFITCPTLGQLKTFLGFTVSETSSSSSGGASGAGSPPTESEPDTSTTLSSDGEQSKIDSDEEEDVRNAPRGHSLLHHFRATSTLLQGNPKRARSTLFLLPDGSGSATSYASLPPISPAGDIAVYGLNCPWLKDATHLVEFGLRGLSELYVSEILRRQPRGPYDLGGWSAGGICAYEVALMLTRAGHRVDRLILIDSPSPIGLEKLPPRLYDFLDAQNVFGSENPHGAAGGGGSKAPEWLLAHFLAFVEALDNYVAVPWEMALRSFKVGKGLENPLPSPPRAYLLWAEDGVCKNPEDPRPEYSDDDPREMRWLLENRTSFGPNGWEALLGGEENTFVDRISGANHFTMLKRGRNSGLVADFLARAFA
ncbi:type I polyketide synthase [Colletotrichum acutatum]|uniref:Type I polyketide synthase n=1 Tax=Glomerella acutata TaxID=27357 RepID=A0AAD8URX3_GLOAC|nr:type I polyketide synthase [Colletotrichum acutatum]KAK1725305.1 type I polyketide synthase [Colletotrichum acutatum]